MLFGSSSFWARVALSLAAASLTGSAGKLGAEDEQRLPPEVVAAFKGHTEIVYAIAFNPNGKEIVTGSFDQSLKIWDIASGKELKTLVGPSGHHNLVLCATFSPDGKTIASGGADNAVKLWTKDGVRSLGHANLVEAVAFNPAGTLLATGSQDGTLRIWDASKGQQVRQINAHVQPSVQAVYSVAWSPDGKQIASGSNDATMKLWDANTGKLVREFRAYKPKDFEKGHRDGIFCLAFSPDGRQLASGSSDHSIKLWNVGDGSVSRELVNPALKPIPLWPPQAHPGWVYSVRFSPDGTTLASAGNAPGNRGYLALWNVASGALLHGAVLPLGPIYSVAVSPNGKLLGLACGPRSRQGSQGNAYLLKMPPLDPRQSAKVAR
jgi:WD40 repeat protein